MVTSTWQTRELPILEAIARAEADDQDIDSGEVADATGLPSTTVTAGLRALLDADMLTGAKVNTFGGFGMLMIRLRERGRRAVGQWPSGDAVADLVALIDARQTATTDPEERTKLRALASGLLDVGKGAASEYPGRLRQASDRHVMRAHGRHAGRRSQRR